MGTDNKNAQKHDRKDADGVTLSENASFNAQAGTAAKGSGAKHADEPAGMEDVPKGASQAYRTEYANVIRDFHDDKLRNNKNQIVREIGEAKVLAAAKAAKIDPLGESKQVS